MLFQVIESNAKAEEEDAFDFIVTIGSVGVPIRADGDCNLKMTSENGSMIPNLYRTRFIAATFQTTHTLNLYCRSAHVPWTVYTLIMDARSMSAPCGDRRRLA